MSPKTPSSRPRLFAAVALIALAGALGVLYVIPTSAVHATAKRPPELAHLVLKPSLPAAPMVSFVEPGGGRGTLTSFRGHYVLLNLWATWCAPCVGELPQLAGLTAALPGVRVIAVNVGRDDVVQTAAFLKDHGAAKLDVYVDSDRALIPAFNAEGLPFSVLLDPQGREIAMAEGPCDWGTPAAVDYLRTLITPSAHAPS